MDIQCVHRVRQGYVRSCTALINLIRGLLGEYGIVIRQGAACLRTHLPAIIDDEKNELSAVMRRNLRSLYKTLCFLDEQVHDQDLTLRELAKNNEACQRLMKIPGIGVLTATILLSVAGVASHFKNGRQFPHFLDLCRVKIPQAAKQGSSVFPSEETPLSERFLSIGPEPFYAVPDRRKENKVHG